MKILQNNSKTHIDTFMETLINSVSYGRKVFIDISSWERLDETSLPEGKGFCNNLNMKDITDANFKHVKKV